MKTRRRKKPTKKFGRPPTDRSASLSKLRAAGIFHLADARKAGITRPSLMRLVEAGAIEHLGHDLYKHPSVDLDPIQESFAVACHALGKRAVVSGLSALAYYNLTEQVPSRIWLLVPYATKSRTSVYRCIRTKTDLTIGIDQQKHFRITNIERTIVEALHYSTKIGLETALKAALQAVKKRRTTATRILDQAYQLGLEKFITRHWEAINMATTS